MKIESIPVVDLRDFDSGDAERRAAFVGVLGESLERLGFVAVRGHGIDLELIERGYAVAAETFALAEPVKRVYTTPEDGHQRGYTPFGLERAKDQAAPDLKEFWHVGRALPAGHPLTVSGAIPANRFPAEVPAFEDVFAALFTSFEGFAWKLLDAIGAHLGQPASYFRAMVQDGNSVLRIINYPDMGVKVPAGAVRAAAHEDINLLTVLPASTRPGLELLTRDGEWVSLETLADAMICDTGDMMQRVTGGMLPATTHRVVNPEGSDGGRMSMPFFLHPGSDVMLTPLRDNGQPAVRTHDFLMQRLRENGVV